MTTVVQQTEPSRLKRYIVRACLAVAAVLLATAAVAALALAYFYEAEGIQGYGSPYLRSVDSQFVDTPTARFHYTKTGTGSPVVLVHGGGGWLYTYRQLIDDLAETHTVYAVDLPGHGYTEVRQGDFAFGLQSMTDSIAVFMDAVELDRASLVGHSWGGGWALRWAQLHPDRVDRLVLIDSSGLDFEDVWDWRILEFPVIGELIVNLMERSDAQALLAKSFHNQPMLTDELVNEYWAPGSQPLARKALLELQRNLDWSITERSLADTITPTLVLWGDKDRFLDVKLAFRFIEAMPNAIKHVLADCGHSAHEDCPEQAIPAIATFLAD